MSEQKSAWEIKIIHDLANTEIAKHIRKDLKEAFGNNFKFSVTSPNNSIDINIMEWNIWIITLEYTKYENIQDWSRCRKLREEWKKYTEKWESILKQVEEIRNLYNHDRSDIQSDYFDVNYYGGVEIGRWDKPYILK